MEHLGQLHRYTQTHQEYMNFKDINDKIKASENFSFFRWGDGEFSCMRGDSGQNCDKHFYSPDLCQALRKSYSAMYHENVSYFGIQNHARKTMGEYVDKWVVGKTFSNPLCDADVFVKASQNDVLSDLFKALKHRRVIFVAPLRYTEFDKFDFHHVVIPDVNCWSRYDWVMNRLMEAVHADDVVLYSASMMSNVLMAQLYDTDITQIDVGSVFEPYLGNANRKYHNDIINRLNK